MNVKEKLLTDVIVQLITAGDALRHYSDCDSKAAVDAEEYWLIAKDEAEELLDNRNCEGGSCAL